MAVEGRKPKAGQKRSRAKPSYDWTEIPDVPYDGPRPELPQKMRATQDWWEAISHLPHCVLWTPADWRFALDTARIHAKFSRGDMHVAAELRQREQIMGATVDARRDLRIRYVSPEEETEEGVTSLADYRTAIGL